MPRFLHIGKFYPPHRGGIESHVRDLATRQVNAGQVSVIASSSGNRSSCEIIEGVRVIRVARLATVASMPVCPGLVSAIRNCPADLVHLHTPNPGAAAALLLSGHRGKIVITHHSDTLGRRVLRAFAHPFVRAVMNRASAIIATSHGYLDSSEEMRPFREKCCVIPLGIDVAALDTADGDPANNASPPLVLSIGRLVPYKGFDVLIRAMSSVNARLSLIGSGPEEENLRKLIRVHGVQEKVEILGRVEDVKPWFQKASVFVMPSVTRAEAFGIAQLEAMAAGLPVVNTRVDSGVPEVAIDGLTGITVEPGNADALAGAVNFLLKNDEIRGRWGAAARARVREEFTADQMAERTLALYQSVLSRN